MPRALYSESERLRRIHRILVMFYQEHRSQVEIAEELGLSPATVNRMVREGHERGLIEIRLRPPFGLETGLAAMLKRLGKLENAIAVNAASTDPEIVLKAVADAAATVLLDELDDGMTVAVSGGVALCALIEALKPARRYDIKVVAATGSVQGKFRTDVNHVAVAMAEKLGGEAVQLHAPVFAGSEDERDALLSVSTISKVLDLARSAQIAVFGIGSVVEADSTYLTLADMVDRDAIGRAGAAGELLAHLVDRNGQVCDLPANDHLVALTLGDLKAIPRRIAVASGVTKVDSIAAVLRGGIVGTLVTDEGSARNVITRLEVRPNAATA